MTKRAETGEQLMGRDGLPIPKFDGDIDPVRALLKFVRDIDAIRMGIHFPDDHLGYIRPSGAPPVTKESAVMASGNKPAVLIRHERYNDDYRGVDRTSFITLDNQHPSGTRGLVPSVIIEFTTQRFEHGWLDDTGYVRITYAGQETRPDQFPIIWDRTGDDPPRQPDAAPDINRAVQAITHLLI